MNALKKLVMGVAVLIVLLVGIGFLLPDTAHVERSTVLSAKPATVFAVLNGFRHFNKWSPWADMDPNATMSYQGPTAGVDAKMSWAGNSSVGSGSQEIVESTPYRQIKIKLVFGGWDNINHATYLLEPEGEGTKITWTYDTEFQGSLVGRYFGLMMDGMIGKDYEKGLTRLKTFVEAMPKADFSSLQAEVVQVEPVTIAYVSGRTATDGRAISTAYAVAHSKVIGYLHARRLRQIAPPVAVIRKWDPQNKVFEYDAGIPVEHRVNSESEVQFEQTYGGTALKVIHKGPYHNMDKTYDMLMAYVAVAGLEKNGNVWEQYMSAPGSTPEAELVTHIYYPIK